MISVYCCIIVKVTYSHAIKTKNYGLMKPRTHKKNLKAGLAAALVIPASILAGPLHAGSNIVPMDQVRWSYEGDLFGCEVSLVAPIYGRLSINRIAGKSLKASYSPSASLEGVSRATWINAPWQDEAGGKRQKMKKSNGAYDLSASATKKLIRALDVGTWTLVSHGDDAIIIPSISWSDAADAFRKCQKTLSPLTIEDARDQHLFYAPGQRSLSKSQMKTIDDIAKYVAIDDKVSRILVDSYTDKSGTRLGNLQISRERAADVVSALKERGISEAIIEGRAHGQRLTISGSNIVNGVNTARKVTIRIIRGEIPEKEGSLEAPVITEPDLHYEEESQAEEIEKKMSKIQLKDE
jgi:outer membrane protein OmpA-like peptidoglycan-associated protein